MLDFLAAHEGENIAARLAKRDRARRGIHDGAHGRVGRDAPQQPAADIPVGHGADQPALIVDDEADLDGPGGEPLDQGVDRGVRADQALRKPRLRRRDLPDGRRVD